MKRFYLVFLLLALFTTAGYAQAKFDITNQSVSSPSRLRQLLTNRFGLVESDITDLMSMAGLADAKIYYISSVTGNSGYSGLDKSYPLALTSQAVAKLTANKGDIIFALPGHAETISSAALSPTLSVAGASLIGIGNGTLQPTYTITHVDGTVSITGANTRLSNVRIVSNLDNVKVSCTIAATAAGAVVDHCVFRDSAANKDFLVGISVAADSAKVKLLYNDFRTTAAAGGNNAILAADVNDLDIVGNLAYGKFATGAILTSAVSKRVIITDNILVNAEAEIAIALNGTTTTGVIARNFLGGTTSIAEAMTGDDAMWCFENYVTGAAGASGIINPAVDSDG